MKKIGSVLFLALLLTACMKTAKFLPGEGEAAECYLCGMNEESLMSLYRGRNSIGILCADRFSVLDIYAENEKISWREDSASGENSVRMLFRGESRGTVTVAAKRDRRSSEVRIELGEKDRLNLDDLRGKLCEACMEKFERMQQESGEGLADVFLVDLKTAEVYPLNNSGRFYVGDYLVIVEAEGEKIAVTVTKV